jgi:hypothetical protein
MPTYTLSLSAKDNDPKLVKIVKSLLNATNLNRKDPLAVDEIADKKIFARASQFSGLYSLGDANGFISTRTIVYLATKYAHTLRLTNVEPLWLGKYFRVCLGAYFAPFDVEIFLSMYKENFRSYLPAGAAWMDNFRRFLGFLSRDTEVRDRRWAAYMLATALHENRAKEDNWKATWDPVGESDGNKNWYGQPEIVVDWKKKPVDAAGNRIAPITDADELKKMASKLVTIGGSKYPNDKVVQRLYHGRGYSQITHQDNYRAMDEVFNLNGALLVDPDLTARDAELSYKILSYGMRMGSFCGAKKRVKGQGFVGGHKLADFLNNSRTDYFSARDIINPGRGYARDIEGYALNFEAILEASARV